MARRWAQKRSVGTGSRHSFRCALKLILVTSAVGLSRTIGRVEARVKGLSYFRMSDRAKCVLVASSNSDILPDRFRIDTNVLGR